MKQLRTLVFIWILHTGLLFSQTSKGNYLIGITSTVSNTGLPQIGYQTEKRKGDGFESDTQKSFNVNLSPKFGLFLWENLVAGIEGNLNLLRVKNDSFGSRDINGNAYLVGPFLRYYIGKGQVRFFAEGGALFGRIKTEFDDPDINGFDFTSKSNLTSFGGGLGIAAFLGNRVSFNTVLIYNSFIDKNVLDNPSNERTLRSGIQLKAGFSIYLD